MGKLWIVILLYKLFNYKVGMKFVSDSRWSDHYPFSSGKHSVQPHLIVPGSYGKWNCPRHPPCRPRQILCNCYTCTWINASGIWKGQYRLLRRKLPRCLSCTLMVRRSVQLARLGLWNIFEVSTSGWHILLLGVLLRVALIN